jgi:catechol 2,3-dioxygenase-like lactoylglutathione lyase family enzyme
MTDRAHVALYGLDLARLAAYYTTIAGFEIHEVDDGFTTLQIPTLELVLVRVRPEHAGAAAVASPPKRRADTPIKVSLVVPSLAGAREAAPALGAVVDPSEAEWSRSGYTRVDGHDPEGNVVQLMEIAEASD